MLHSAASDLGLHCLQITLLGVSRLKWDSTKRKGVLEAYMDSKDPDLAAHPGSQIRIFTVLEILSLQITVSLGALLPVDTI